MGTGVAQVPKELRKKMARMIFEKGVTLVNREVDFQNVKDRYFPHEDRTLCLNIRGMEDVDTGFVFEGGHVRSIRKLTDKPTVTLTMDEDVFLSICSGSLKITEAWLYNFVAATGEHLMRDMVVFQRIFDEYGKVITGKVRA